MNEDSWIHYVVTLVFFIVLIVATITLTISVYNMDITPGDSAGLHAQNSIKTAAITGWVAIGLILAGLSIAGVLMITDQYNETIIADTISELTGQEKAAIAIRFLVFFVLVFSSVLIAILLTIAAEFILKTPNPEQYTDQYDNCIKFAKIMYLHTALIIIIQSLVYFYSYIKTCQNKYD